MAEFNAAEARRAQQLAIFDTVIELAPVVGKALSATAGKVVGGVLKYGTLPAADFEKVVKEFISRPRQEMPFLHKSTTSKTNWTSA